MLGETLNEAVLDKCINKQKSLLKSKSNATTRDSPPPQGDRFCEKTGSFSVRPFESETFVVSFFLRAVGIR